MNVLLNKRNKKYIPSSAFKLLNASEMMCKPRSYFAKINGCKRNVVTLAQCESESLRDFYFYGSICLTNAHTEC